MLESAPGSGESPRASSSLVRESARPCASLPAERVGDVCAVAGQLDRQCLVGAADGLGALERPQCLVLERELERRLGGGEQRVCPLYWIGERVGEQPPAVQRSFVLGQFGGERRDRMLERHDLGCGEADLIGDAFELRQALFAE